MIDHIGISVQDFAAAKAFYLKALAPLGYELLMEFPSSVTGTTDVAGFGKPPKPDFWIAGDVSPISKIHIAIAADSREAVDQFYAAAIAAGGKDNGKPGLRPQYHPGYYGAFVFDLDGHNIEAVHHSH